ncbi:class F sortase [Streptomyces sp. NPDC048566]|uniref:class F sortase n=1 Tax=Streptomyces sp. NPDC048566 TaxID=3365569 RepID=UPI003719A9BA
MTALSRRAFAAAALAGLLAGCDGAADHRAPAAHATAGGAVDLPGGATPSGPHAAESPRALGRSVPVGLRIPAIGVDTAVLALGLAPDGGVQVPPVVAHDKAGWYRHSPTPGQTGPSVILGHVTVGAHGDGVFRHLARLRRGDRVDVRLENGRAPVFTVGSVRTVAKTAFPSDAVYGDVDRPELRLITCGGARTGDGYADNVIVFATLGSGAP